MMGCGQAGTGSMVGSLGSPPSVAKPLEEGSCACWWVAHNVPWTHGKQSWEPWGQGHACSLQGGWAQPHAFWGGCSVVPHHLAGSLSRGEILCPSLDMILEQLLPCSGMTFNDTAVGQCCSSPWCWVLPACSGRSVGSLGWGCPGRLKAQDPLMSWGFHFSFRSKSHIRAKCRCCWGPPRRAASSS